ncbi:hypothetical protein Bca101_092181 [Brassica carinata]
MAISHALQPLLLLLLSLFFLPAALGAFVNFTNCRVSKPNRRVNVTSISIDPYPLPLSRLTYFTITAETSKQFSVPLVLNPVHLTYPLCPFVKACPVTAGPTVIKLDFVNSGADDLRIVSFSLH